MRNENNFSLLKMLLGLAILLISILLLFSVSVDIMTLFDDYRTLQSASLNFIKLFRLDLPAVHNPIGPFGVFFGFWMITILGKFFSISLLLTFLLLGFISIFFQNERNFVWKILCFLIFAFFFNFVMFVLRQDAMIHAGYIPWKAFEFMIAVFEKTGTLIISSAIAVTALIFIFDFQNVKSVFIFIFKSIWKMISGIFKLLKPSRIKKVKPKPAKIKKIKERKETPKIGKVDPNIIDHNRNNGEITVTEPTNISVKSRIKASDTVQKNTDQQEYVKPDIEEFLSSSKGSKKDMENIRDNIKRVSTILIGKLLEFGVEAEVVNVNIGPIITQYEIKPAPGVKVNKFNTLADDLALAIKATSIRVQAPIPGRGLVGIEVPNIQRDTIYLKDILVSDVMNAQESSLAIALGKDISGHPVVNDLSKMPHLLIAGATGSGKSVCVNTIICTLLFRTDPEEVRIIMIDPKRIELSGYEGIPHLVQNVVTNNEEALMALNWGVAEMEKRYDLLQKYKVKDLKAYNKKIKKLKETDEELEDDTRPYIIIVVDELADLMMTVGREVERPITRLAQMARAIGIHLILATQRPSIKVITGIIKANFPSRIAFKVSSKIDSRVIIDANGAERLLGLGDMLFLPPGKGDTERIHGAYIPPAEILNLVNYLKTQPKPEQEITIISDEEESNLEDFEYDDELFPEAAVAVVTAGSASVSMLQRHFKVGYARAGRLIDMLERAGIIGPHVGSKSREVLASEEDMKIYGYIPD
jgi:DNA segregation ATPase FtsK/SpoIIIE, S-DNA-T family